MFLRRFYNLFLDILYPRYCLRCDDYGSYLCEDCARELLLSEMRAVCPVCFNLKEYRDQCAYCGRSRKQKIALDKIIAAGDYGNYFIRQALHLFKYEGVDSIGYTIGKETGKKLDSYLKVIGIQRDKMVVMPVPLHSSRRRERGFNQAEILAYEIARICNLRFDFSSLKKMKKTRPQMRLGKADRCMNLQGSFKLDTSGIDLKDKIVCLVDDIFTTGATLSECSAVLKQEGVREVWGVVVARQFH